MYANLINFFTQNVVKLNWHVFSVFLALAHLRV